MTDTLGDALHETPAPSQDLINRAGELVGKALGIPPAGLDAFWELSSDMFWRRTRDAIATEFAAVAEQAELAGAKEAHDRLEKFCGEQAAEIERLLIKLATVEREAIEQAAKRLDGNPRWINAAAAIRALTATKPERDPVSGMEEDHRFRTAGLIAEKEEMHEERDALAAENARLRVQVEFFNHTFQPIVGMARLALDNGDEVRAKFQLDRLNDEWDKSHAALAALEGEPG